MSTDWLARLPSSAAWAHLSWREVSALPADLRARLPVILPLHGFADHGLGLPLDAEEVLGSAVLARALEAGAPEVRVLPPLRFALAPYPSCFFGVDPETAHALVRETAAGVAAAGFRHLVFFNTSPWNEEFVDAASCDLRAATGMHTYYIHLSALGCDFHPGGTGRRLARAAVLHALGCEQAGQARTGEVRDGDFRPGNYRQPEPLAPDPGPSPDGAGALATAAGRLARLLGEIALRTGTSASAALAAQEDRAGSAWPASYRVSNYLPAFDRERLEALPDKAAALAIVPTGAIEQHGPHLPLGVDAMIGQALLAAALPKLPPGARVFVTPPVTVGKSNEHTGFAGTLSVSAGTLRRLLLALACQLKSLGFRQMAVLNTHGGNSAVVVYTLREIQTTLGLRAGMLSGYYRPELAPQEAAYGIHAGEWETSLMLAIAPEWVRMEHAVCEYPARLDDPGELRPENAPAIVSWLTRDISTSGVMGDARAASPEKGRRWLDEASTALAHRISALLEATP
jgi:creatinine amidohydrolase